MTEKNTPISDLMAKIKDGVSKVGMKQNQPTSEPDPEKDENGLDGVTPNSHGQEHDDSSYEDSGHGRPADRLHPDDDDIIDAEIISMQERSPTTLERLKGISKGQKIVFAVLIVAGVLAVKNQLSNYEITTGSSAPSEVVEVSGLPFGTDETEGELDSPLPPSSFSEDGVSLSAEQSGFDIDDPLLLSGGSDSPLGKLTAQPTEETPSASLTGGDDLFSVKTDSESDADQPITPETNSPTEERPLSVATGEAQPSNPFSSDMTDEDVATSEIEKTEVNAFDTPFGGTTSLNQDSGKPVLESAESASEASVLKAEIAAKDKSIAELNAKLAKALTQTPPAQIKTAAVKTVTQAPRQAPKPKPTQSKSTQAKTAPAVAARPQLCVAAVAQAARNCTTCVPHAFITHKGNESMVGHGDFIEGYRVSITDDRLDLQNSAGEVAHKFWSSPNGCRTN